MENDPGLAQSVTFEARHQSLENVFAELSKQSHVSLKAEGEAADLRITAWLSEQPLRRVLTRLSTLLQLSWRKTGTGDQLEYSLFQSSKDRQAYRAAYQAEKNEYRDRCQRLLLAAANPALLGDSPLDRAAQAHARNRVISSGAALLAAFPNATFDQLFDERGIEVALGGMNAVQKANLERFLAEVYAQQPDLHQQLTALGLTRPEPVKPMLSERTRVSARIGLNEGVSLQVPDAGPIGGISFGPGELTQADRLAMPRQFGSRAIAPGLALAPASLKSGPTWEPILLQLAKTNGVGVISDAYDAEVRSILEEYNWLLPASADTAQVLDRLCCAVNYTWNASDPLILFRRKSWAIDRETQIPARLERRWQQLAKEPGYYLIFELAQMTRLRLSGQSDQIKLVRYVGKEAATGLLRSPTDVLLKLLALLDPEQHELAGGPGLTADRLTLTQKRQAGPIVLAIRPEAVQLQRSLQSITVSPVEMKSATVTLRFRDGYTISHSVDLIAKPLKDPWK